MKLIVQSCPSFWLFFKPLWLSKWLNLFLIDHSCWGWQDLSAFWKEGSQLVPNFRLSGSQILRQQLLKYANICIQFCGTTWIKACWSPKPRQSRGVVPGQQLEKIGLQMNVKAPFWEIPVSHSKAEEEHKDGVHWPRASTAPLLASGCVPNLKCSPQASWSPRTSK